MTPYQKTDTHYYDGKMKDILSVILPDIYRVLQLTHQQHLDLFMQVRNKLHSPDPRILQNFDTIVRDWGKMPNWDPSNHVRVEPLLYLVCEIANISCDAVELLKHQLIEMSTGMCPQGRSTRLIQIYFAIR